MHQEQAYRQRGSQGRTAQTVSDRAAEASETPGVERKSGSHSHVAGAEDRFRGGGGGERGADER